MPCRARHLKIGILIGAVGGGTYSAVRQYQDLQYHSQGEFDISEVLWGAAKGGVVGGVGAAVPDILEPAITPNHRGFFHSAPLLVALMIIAAGIFGRSKSALMGLVFSFVLGYISHLWADGNTSQGLPA